MSNPNDHRLKLIFYDILRGCNQVSLPPETVFIKHFTTSDLGDLEGEAHRFFEEAKSFGVPTYKEKEEYLKSVGLWTQDEEIEEAELTQSISTMNLTRTKVIKERDRAEIDKAILEVKDRLNILRLRKNSLIGETCEMYSARKFNNYCVYYSFYKDKALKQRYFENDSFDYLDEEGLIKFVSVYSENSVKFKEDNFKKIAIAPFFINIFHLSEDNPYTFYGRPIVDLTFFQIELFNLGRYFKPILAEWRDKLPEDILSDPDKLIENVSMNIKAKEALAKGEKEGESTRRVSIVGATKEELKKLGGEVISFKETAKKHGGIATFQDIIKAHGM